MSVLIKGMKMPTSCWRCPLKQIDGMDIVCDVVRERVAIADDKILKCRLDRCPLVEIPPHGRLIDADVLMKKIIEHINAAINWKDLASANGDGESVIRADQAIASFCEIGLTAKALPTIIEAEECDHG